MNATTLNQTDCPEVTIPLSIFFTIGAVSLTVNLLVVVAILCNRNLHTPMYCFICSLAAFNTISSTTKTFENLMLAFADVGHLKKKGFSELKLDDVMDSLLCMSFVGSILSFLAIAVDRYVCKSCFFSAQKCSKKAFVVLLAFIFYRVKGGFDTHIFHTSPRTPSFPVSKTFWDFIMKGILFHFKSKEPLALVAGKKSMNHSGYFKCASINFSPYRQMILCWYINTKHLVSLTRIHGPEYLLGHILLQMSSNPPSNFNEL